MSRSIYAQPLPAVWAGNAAAGHERKGEALNGGSRIHPELFAAGLWSTPADLARFALAIQRALRGDRDAPFSHAMATAMTTRVDGGPTSPGFFIDGAWFFHRGSNAGFRCILKAHKTAGYGAIIMTNSEHGESFYEAILRALGEAYDWESVPDEERNSLR